MPYDLAIPLLGKERNSNLKRYVHPSVHSSTVYNSQDVETTSTPIDRCMDKGDVLHTRAEYDSVIKKNKILPFAAASIDLESVTLSEVGQTERDDTTWYHLYIESKKNK